MNPAIPRTVALLMTDLVGSTRLWEQDPQSMDRALRRHDELVQEVANEFLGNAPKGRGEGDSAFFIFPTVALACQAAHALQLKIRNVVTSSGVELELPSATKPRTAIATAAARNARPAN